MVEHPDGSPWLASANQGLLGIALVSVAVELELLVERPPGDVALPWLVLVTLLPVLLLVLY
jgi:hypothetical protein